MDELKTWIREKFAPKVLVVSSKPAKDFCNRYHASPAQFLQQFCTRTQGFSIRSLTTEIHHPFFRLTIVDTLDTPLDRAILSATGPKVDWEDTHIHGAQDVNVYMSSDTTPWFTAWQNNFLQAQSFKVHELIDMPVAILYVACTNEVNPIEVFQTMSRSDALPDQYKNQFYSPKVPRVYLLLHDLANSAVSGQQATAIVENMKLVFRPSMCKMQAFGSTEVGTPLSTSDKSQFSMILNEVVTRILSPFVQTVLKEMDLFLEKNKRGFKNTVKSFFKKGGDKAEAFTFQLDSVEHTSRYLADLAFLFGDYDLALSHYRGVANDFKSAKAWRHAAAAFEMQALCAVLLSGDPREMDYALDSAYGMYEKAGDQALMVRSTLFTFQVYKGLDAPKRLVHNLMLTGNDVKEYPEVYPLFLEQTALCFLRLRPAHFRKFAFYKILAGDEYRKLKMITFALHCYFITYPLYKGKSWHHVQLHLEHNLARFAYFLDLPLEGVHFFLSVADCPQLLDTSDQHQKKVLNELMSTVSKWTSAIFPEDRDPILNQAIDFAADHKPILSFPLPHFLSIQVHLALDDDCEKFKPDLRTSSSWIDLLKTVDHSPTAEEECQLYDCNKETDFNKMTTRIKRKSFVDEELRVHVAVRNPLKLTLIIENLQVLTSFGDGMIVNDGVETVPIERVELQPESYTDLVLRVTPKKSGALVVTGVQWMFGGLLHCRHTFSPKQIKDNSRKTEKVYIPNQCNRVLIQPVQARLEVKLLSIGIQTNSQVILLQGQLETCSFYLKNVSSVLATNVRLVFSDTRVFGARNVECGRLEPGQETKVGVLCRGDELGISIIRILVVYTSLDLFRFQRLQLAVEVREAVRTSVRLDNSVKRVQESTLAVSMNCLYPGKLVLTQVSCATMCDVTLMNVVRADLLCFKVSDKGNRPDLLLVKQDDLLAIGEAVDVRRPPYSFFLQKTTGSQKEFIVFWELSANDRVVKGMQSFVASPKDPLPIHLVMEAPTQLVHDFSVQP